MDARQAADNPADIRQHVERAVGCQAVNIPDLIQLPDDIIVAFLEGLQHVLNEALIAIQGGFSGNLGNGRRV